MKKVILKNLDDLVQISSEIVSKIQNSKSPFIIYLNGPLGSGKTTLTKEIIRMLGVSENVTSPTFVYQRNYSTNTFNIHHFDLYRLEAIDEDKKGEVLKEIGFHDAMIDNNSVIIVEWSTICKNLIPKPNININITLNSDYRVFEIV